MSDVMHFNFAENGILSAIPYLVMWFVSICSGVIADWVLANNLLGVTALRKLLATIGGVGPAVGVVLASYAGCDKTLVSVLFAVGMGLMGFFYASLRVNALDLSPNFSGTIMALVNGSGALSGMVTPTLVGLLTENKTLGEWRVVFWIMALVLIATNFVYLFFGSGELQPWNEPKPKPDSEANNVDTAQEAASKNGAIINNSSQDLTKNGFGENGLKNTMILQIADSGN
ncbi:hypothetical protein LSTR_LSTR008639 [Laodelphax striatellus]|uniref:Major facilitator superfamily (MFS) profile domain-containing protein n=1 Tax=Laodelphax striatellus TaxID=195883 RepID=A0A482WM81_LAOST|nr:hypothetical protein LSTR_LSTR008639 [Laodelphax striatellus]